MPHGAQSRGCWRSGATRTSEIAQLLVSEVVTNALLHAGTDMELRTTAAASGVRIEVHDGSGLAPTQRHYGDEAATGRGLGLVESLASAWGIEPTGSGKAVWFELGTVDHPVDHGDEPPADPAAGPTEVVHLLALPPALVHATLQYGDAVLRELVLLSVAGDLGDDVSPVYVTPEVGLSDVLTAVEAALADDRPAVDVEVTLPRAQANPALERLALVDEADRLAREGRLLTAPAVPEISACRRWLMGQIAVQLRGDEPTAWLLPAKADTDAPWRPLTGDEVHALSPTGIAVMVADTANRIVFVSDEAALLLGWHATGSLGDDSRRSSRLTSVRPTSPASPASR